MQEFFTWSVLATYAGATLATTFITQLLKGVSVIQKLPTQIFSYLVALVVLVTANVAVNGLSLDVLGLSVVNAVVVSLAANGAFEAVKGKTE